MILWKRFGFDVSQTWLALNVSSPTYSVGESTLFFGVSIFIVKNGYIG